jgi:hypothetical protein
VLLLKIRDESSLVIQKEERRNGGQAGLYLCHMPHDYRGLNLSECLKGHKLRVFDISGAVTVFTPDMSVTRQGCSQTLPGHLKEPKL